MVKNRKLEKSIADASGSSFLWYTEMQVRMVAENVYRDLNAAENIERVGVNSLYNGVAERT